MAAAGSRLRYASADGIYSAKVQAVQGAAACMSEAVANSAAVSTGGGTYYSGNTPIVINVAGKEAIRSTLDELIRTVRLSDSRIF